MNQAGIMKTARDAGALDEPTKYKPGGRPKGSRNVVTKAMSDALFEYLAEHPEGQPLLFLATVIADPNNPLNHRILAAKELSKYCAPRIMAVPEDDTSNQGNRSRILIEQLQMLVMGAQPAAALPPAEGAERGA